MFFSFPPAPQTLPNLHRCSCLLPPCQMRRRNHGTLNPLSLVAGDPSATAVPLRVQSMQAAWLPAAGRCLLSLQAPTLPSHLHSLLPGFLLPREKWGSRKEARLPRHSCAHQHLRLTQTPFLPMAQTLLENSLAVSYSPPRLTHCSRVSLHFSLVICAPLCSFWIILPPGCKPAPISSIV